MFETWNHVEMTETPLLSSQAPDTYSLVDLTIRA